MVRLRPLLRASIRIFDAAFLLHVRAVCVAGPLAQRRAGVRIRTGVAHRRAVRSGRGDFDAVAHYPVYRVTASDPSWSAFWAHWIALPYWSVGPLWFLWQLLVLDLAAAALFWLAPGLGGRAANVQAKGRRTSRALHRRFYGGFDPRLSAPGFDFQTIGSGIQIGPFSVQSAQAPLFTLYFFAGVAAGANGSSAASSIRTACWRGAGGSGLGWPPPHSSRGLAFRR